MTEKNIILTPRAQPDWAQLQNLRQIYVAGKSTTNPSAGVAVYWDSQTLLRDYHHTLGQRIKWKWSAILPELLAAKKLTPGPELIDFGCGTGIATLALLEQLPPSTIAKVHLYDHSTAALAFAKTAITSTHPQVTVLSYHRFADLPATADLLIASHVLTELAASERQRLTAIASRCQQALFVDAGTREVSQHLVTLRQALQLHGFNAVAPCPHSGPCPLEDTSTAAAHWCHQFAQAPREVFQSAYWQAFSRELKIDLRSLPLAYLLVTQGQQPTATADGIMLGRAKRGKAWFDLSLCTAGGQISALRLSKKSNKEAFNPLKSDPTTYRTT